MTELNEAQIAHAAKPKKDIIGSLSHTREQVDLMIIDLAFRSLDELITACLAPDGSIVAPSKKALTEARAHLSIKYANTFVKNK